MSTIAATSRRHPANPQPGRDPRRLRYHRVLAFPFGHDFPDLPLVDRIDVRDAGLSHVRERRASDIHPPAMAPGAGSAARGLGEGVAGDQKSNPTAIGAGNG